MATFFWKRGDTGAATATLKDGDAVAVNLTGATVKFIMRPTWPGPLKIDRAIDLDDATNGVVSIDRTSADTDTAGHYHAEFEVTYASGDVETFPERGYIDVMIEGDLG